MTKNDHDVSYLRGDSEVERYLELVKSLSSKQMSQIKRRAKDRKRALKILEKR